MKPYYDSDGITIYCGDCRDIVPSLIFDVIVTDPPYACHMKFDVYLDTCDHWLPLISWLLSLPYPLALTMSQMRLFDLPTRPQWIGCWDKVFTAGIVHVGAKPSWEPICFYNLPAGDHGKPRWPDIFRCPPHGFPFNVSRDPNGHPCPKPMNLYKQLIRMMPSGIILDPMMGKGTTLCAAKASGRSAIGIDVSEAYCEMAVMELAQQVLPFAERVEYQLRLENT